MKDTLGYNQTWELWDKVPDQVCRKTADFMRPVMEAFKSMEMMDFADVGERNKKIEVIEHQYNVRFDTLDAKDFNREPLAPVGKQYDVITCFEVLEHIQNPLYLMDQIVTCLKPDGVLYISTPGRPKWMWSDIHFHEMDSKRVKRWIFEPLGLRVVRQSKINMYYPRWKVFMGIRPMIRAYHCNTNIYMLMRNIFFDPSHCGTE